jgi:hypothetical protein
MLSIKIASQIFLPVIYQVISHQTHAVGLDFVEKKILRILDGTARIVVTWFSQYSCLKVQNFAIIGQL